ncbi:MAG: zinc ribbon domain-containing protein [Candidatus Wallbacteria bacterium]|nr:zinc ribbon domain-containing protein [Candidatus Wallbacteria bacterium]
MRICAACKNENEDTSRFCEGCGAGLEGAEEKASATPDETRACPACHRPHSASARFCAHCGKKVFLPPPPPPGGVVCNACGTAHDHADTFCAWCGIRLAPIPPKPVEAPKGSPELRPNEGPRITVLAGREKDKVYSLGSSGVRIGRSRENDVCLDTDGYVSNHHARIYMEGNEFFIEDSGSVNGTFLRVRRAAKLESGDELKIGQSLFRFEP